MGGAAFASGIEPLKTPRMPFQIYQQLRQYCMQVIRKHYGVVDSLTDAPEKNSFGDIDFLVQEPLSPEANILIADDLQAKRTLVNGPSISLAIPWPSEKTTESNLLNAPVPHIEREDSTNISTSVPNAGVVSASDQAGAEQDTIYAQVDIRLYPSSLSLPWIHYLYSR